jgi:predicted Zn-dependent protease
MPHPITLRPPSSLPAGPPPATVEEGAELQGELTRLRAELDAATDSAREASLLAGIGDCLERANDDAAAARHYLAAHEADRGFREPLESLVRLLEKHPSLKGLGSVFDALVETATTPDEKVRALLLRAAHRDDAEGAPAAQEDAQHAAAVEGAGAADQASAWLTLEVLAGRTGQAQLREQAFAQRAQFAQDPAWLALLLTDQARIAGIHGNIDSALSLCAKAQALNTKGTWAALNLSERILQDHPAPDEATSAAWSAKRSALLDELATLARTSMRDAAWGDAHGVPLWARDPARIADWWARASELHRESGRLAQSAASLDSALSVCEEMADPDRRVCEAVLVRSRIRLAEEQGDSALAASLAAAQLRAESDPPHEAALAFRVAEHAASQKETGRALEALERALRADPGSLPARALQLELMADGADMSALAAQLESFSEHLATDEARGRTFLLAAYVWAVHARDVSSAKAALSQAGMFGVPAEIIGYLARTLASLCADDGWYEDATRRLVATSTAGAEAYSLGAELYRMRYIRQDQEGADKALRELAAVPGGAWLASVLAAFSPAPNEEPATEAAPQKPRPEARAALDELAASETDPGWATVLSMAAAMRAHADGDLNVARRKLRQLAERAGDDATVASYLGDLDRAAGDHAQAAAASSMAAVATADVALSTSLHLEAAFESWRAGERGKALAEIEAAVSQDRAAAGVVAGWAAWGLDPDSLPARRRALDQASSAGGEQHLLALERFATLMAERDFESAAIALAPVDTATNPAVALAAALARLAWPTEWPDSDTLDSALEALAQCSPEAALVAASERVRLARDSGDAERLVFAAQAWFEAGGGLAAALEWLAVAATLEDPREEMRARRAVASLLTGDAREAMLAMAAVLHTRIAQDQPAPLVPGESAAVRLANLELAPPGCDPRRRAAVLEEIDGVLGEEGALDATALAAWARVAASDFEGASAAFEKVVLARPGDVAAWEGLRTCAEAMSNTATRARAAAELGALCQDAKRAAGFWEEAALAWLELGDDASADRALEASFTCDATRPIAFDKLFRRLRDRKDNEKLLPVIARRLQVTTEAAEEEKLFWEQARTLREMGNPEGALKALESVTAVNPDHVGALALLGEINIRRGQFEAAAASLARLAVLDTAPAKNRVTAGIAAVDLYETKLSRFDKSLAVLLSLHRAAISTLPVRERLARAAARSGAWQEATMILEELMRERPDPAGRAEAARLSIAIQRDRLHRPQAAAPAIVALLSEVPADAEGLEMLRRTTHPGEVRTRLLVAARSALLSALQDDPTDAPMVNRLAAVAHDLEDEQVEQTALGVLLALGGGDTQTPQAFARLSDRQRGAPQVAISDNMIQALLAPGDAGPVGDLFVLLGPTLAEAFGPSLQNCGVGRRDRVDPRSGLALRTEIAAWAGAFGAADLELYVGGKDPLGVVGIPGEPAALVVGAGVKAPLSSLSRARVARELLSMVRGTSIVRWRDEIAIAAIVVAACRLAEIRIEHPPYPVLAEVERALGKALARRTRKLLQDVCQPIAETNPDARAWSKRAIASQDRIAVVASADPGIVLADESAAPFVGPSRAARGDARAEELLAFVLSRHYLDLRLALGLEGET